MIEIDVNATYDDNVLISAELHPVDEEQERNTYNRNISLIFYTVGTVSCL